MTPEEEIVLLAIRQVVAGGRPAEWPAADWSQVAALALAHKLAFWLLTAVPAELMPAEVAGRLAQAARQQRIRTAVLTEDFRVAHGRLATAGVRAMPLKGMALAHTVYPSPSLRYFDDIDLLVPSEQAGPALGALQAAGYGPHPNAPRPEWHHLPPHIHLEHGTMIEVHTDLLRRGRAGWDLGGIWQRARPGAVAGVATWLLDPADALIYAALHARHNLFNRLSFFVDGALLVGKVAQDAAAKAALPGLARAAGARLALAYLLDMAGRLWGAGEAGKVGGDMGAFRLRRPLARALAPWDTLAPAGAGSGQGPLARLLELLLMDSLADSLWLGGRLLLPPADFVRQGYGGDGRSAGYARRFLERAGLAAGQFWKGIRGS